MTTDTSDTSSSSSCSSRSSHGVQCRVKRSRTLRQVLSVASIVIVIFASILNVAESIIEIKSLQMPDRIENGTRESIILDCIYSLDESKDKIKLVIKWFFKDDPVPIYQWIPELDKKSYSPRFINKIDDTFSIPHGTAFTKYRALHLINITTDLSGTYSCHVASLTSQDSKKKDLIVYASPKKVGFSYQRLSLQDARALAMSRGNSISSSNRNGQASPLASSSSSASASATASSMNDASPGAILKCAVENVYPKPELTIYGVRRDGSRYAITENVRRRELMSPSNRAHSVYLSAQIFDSEVNRKYLEDAYHPQYSSVYNYHQSSSSSSSSSDHSSIFTDRDQHPFHPRLTDRQHQQHPHQLMSSSSAPPNLSSNTPSSYQFECVSTIDVKLAAGNLTKASALTYTPSSVILASREDSSHFLNSKVSSSSSSSSSNKSIMMTAVHRPNILLCQIASSFLAIVIFLMRPSH